MSNLFREEWFFYFIWSAGGIIIGYIGGVAFATRDGRSVMRFRQLGGLLILIAVAFAGIMNYNNTVQLRDSVFCQRQFNSNYRESLAAQVEASIIENNAIKDFLVPFRSTNTPTEEDRNASFSIIDKEFEKATQLRAEHPIPLINLCGTGVSS